MYRRAGEPGYPCPLYALPRCRVLGGDFTERVGENHPFDRILSCQGTLPSLLCRLSYRRPSRKSPKNDGGSPQTGWGGPENCKCGFGECIWFVGGSCGGYPCGPPFTSDGTDAPSRPRESGERACAADSEGGLDTGLTPTHCSRQKAVHGAKPKLPPVRTTKTLPPALS